MDKVLNMRFGVRVLLAIALMPVAVFAAWTGGSAGVFVSNMLAEEYIRQLALSTSHELMTSFALGGGMAVITVILFTLKVHTSSMKDLEKD